jgi:SAM-dependent methyltransferase
MMLEIIIFIIFLFCATGAYAGIKGAPWVPTDKKTIERFLKLVNIKEGDKVYDLGCGDGRIIFASAENRAITEGFEIALFPFFLANFLKLFKKEKKNIKIRYCDIMKANLSDADVVYFFLMPEVYLKIKEKLEKETKKGTKVVAFVWPIEGWTPIKIDKAEKSSNLYLYEI